MPILLWDASALSKRYVEEIGTETVPALFLQPSVSGMVYTFAGYGEAHSILRRRFNAAHVSAARYAAARALLRLAPCRAPALAQVERFRYG